jgi:hypothetical protein
VWGKFKVARILHLMVGLKPSWLSTVSLTTCCVCRFRHTLPVSPLSLMGLLVSSHHHMSR